jgi:hypothetical protein
LLIIIFEWFFYIKIKVALTGLGYPV